MSLTPVEIRHVRLKRGLFGYSRANVDDLLDEVVLSFEDVWRERADLADRVEHLESELGRHRELESLLRATMMSAEQAANGFREQARREAELIVNEAHSAGRSIMRRAAEERERLVAESQRVRAILEGALAAVEEAAEEPAQDAEAA